MRTSRWFNHEQARRALPYAEEVLLDHRDDPTSLAYVGRQHDKGLKALDRALALNPNSFAALHSSGCSRAYVGDADTAIEQLQRALRANPLVPQYGHGLSALGHAHLVAGRTDEALVTLQTAYVESRTFGITQIAMVYCHARLVRWQEVRDAAVRLRAHDPSVRISTFRALTPRADPLFLQACMSMLEAAGIPAWLARTRSWGSMCQRFGVGLERHDRMHPLASFSVGHADHRSGDHDAGLEQVAGQCL